MDYKNYIPRNIVAGWGWYGEFIPQASEASPGDKFSVSTETATIFQGI